MRRSYWPWEAVRCHSMSRQFVLCVTSLVPYLGHFRNQAAEHGNSNEILERYNRRGTCFPDRGGQNLLCDRLTGGATRRGRFAVCVPLRLRCLHTQRRRWESHRQDAASILRCGMVACTHGRHKQACRQKGRTHVDRPSICRGQRQKTDSTWTHMQSHAALPTQVHKTMSPVTHRSDRLATHGSRHHTRHMHGVMLV
jgi:hypothetical protein